MVEYPKTVSELFPSKWLKAIDLEKPVSIKIVSVYFETVYDAQNHEHVLKLVVGFKGAQKRLIPNKTQCEALWAITQTEVFAEWVGHTVTLTRGKAHNGKPTIVISAPVPQTNENSKSPAPAPEVEVEESQGKIEFDEFWEESDKSDN